VTEGRGLVQARRQQIVELNPGDVVSAPDTSTSFTMFEGTSEIQRMIIGRAVTWLDVR
jgi:mannose-6-phosphate isomerase-like protein (cupin superfamily)